MSHSEGPNSPGTVVDDATIGSVAWSNPTNVTASDDTYATATLNTTTSHYLWCTNFGFSVTGAIQGIKLTVSRKSNGGNVEDNAIRMIVGGAIEGSNKATGDNWSTIEEDFDYGGESDLWGTTLTESEVNASDFGIAISAKWVGGGAQIASVDWVRVTVYYSSADELTSMFVQSSQPLFQKPQRAEGYF